MGRFLQCMMEETNKSVRRGSSRVKQMWKKLKWNKCIFHKRKRKEEALGIMKMKEARRSKKGATIGNIFIRGWETRLVMVEQLKFRYISLLGLL